ncbi:MAG: hypothetical protein AB4372_13975 [Xenococcus sp. (in: cyanobacteria)]
MTNPTIEIDLGEILGEIRQDLKHLSSDVSDLKVGQARLEEKVGNLEKDHNEFKESTRKNLDDLKKLIEKNNNETKELIEKNNDATKESIEKNNNETKELIEKSNNEIKESTRKNFEDLKELIEKNNNEIKELKNAQATLVADVADLKGVKSLIIPIVVAVTTAILTLVAQTISFG